MTKTSIIIPVYNARQFLEECITSVIAQTCKDWELLLVDDGSTDESGKICDDYSRKDNRINVIHTVNSGPCAARNKGLDMATGYYLMFVDADDKLRADALETLLEKMENGDVDIVTAGCYTMNYKGCRISKYVQANVDTLIDGRTQLKEMLMYKNACSVWGKLYRRDLIGENRFDEKTVMADDLLFLTALMELKPCRVLRIPAIVYEYRVVASSLSHGRGDKQIRKNLVFCDILRDRMLETDKELSPYYAYAAYVNLVWCIKLQKIIKHVSEDLLQRMKEMHNNFFQVLTIPVGSSKYVEFEHACLSLDMYATIECVPYHLRELIRWLRNR